MAILSLPRAPENGRNGDEYYNTVEGRFYSFSDGEWQANTTDDIVKPMVETKVEEAIIVNDKILKNTATGTNSLTVGGVASASSRTGSINIGIGSKVTGGINSTVIGDHAISSTDGGIALGHYAKASGGSLPIALGSLAEANAGGAIMIGGGRNNEAKTFKVALSDQPTVATTEEQGLFTLLKSDGTIPAPRLGTLPTEDGSYILKLTITDGVPTLSWVKDISYDTSSGIVDL